MLPQFPAKRLRPVKEPFFLEDLQDRQGGSTADRIPTVSPPQTAHLGCVHHLRPADDGAERHTRCQALGAQDEIRFNPPVFHGKHLAGAANAALNLIGNKDNAIIPANLEQPGEVLGRRGNEAAFAHDRFRDQGGCAFAGHLADEEVLEVVGAGHVAGRVGEAERAAIAIGAGHAVDVGHEGAEPEFVGLDLAGEGHRQIGPTMKGIVETDDARPPGIVASDFHRILHGLGARVGKYSHFGKTARGQAAQLFREPDVDFVHDNVKAGVGKLRSLVLDGGDDSRMAVAHIHDANAARKVNQLPAVDIMQQSPPGLTCKIRGDVERALGNEIRPQLCQLRTDFGTGHNNSCRSLIWHTMTKARPKPGAGDDPSEGNSRAKLC